MLKTYQIIIVANNMGLSGQKHVYLKQEKNVLFKILKKY